MIFSLRWSPVLVLGLLMLPISGWAAGPTPVSLPPSASQRIILTVTGPTGTLQTFTHAQVEALGTYRLTTKTFWPDDDGTYEGVMLADVLKQAKLDTQAKVQVTALDGYSVAIPSEDWTRWQVLLATRRDGRPLTVRNKGPLRLIFPMALDTKLAVRSMGGHWAWMIKSIGIAPK